MTGTATAARPPASRMVRAAGVAGSRSRNSHDPTITRNPVLMTSETGMTTEARPRCSATWNRHMPTAVAESMTYSQGDETARPA